MPMLPTQSLAQLLADRGRLTQGQAITVGVQIARELAMLHASGHVYAGVSAETVLIDGDGRPSLAPATSGGGEPADDVRALAETLRAAAGANAGLALLRVLGQVSDSASFARELYAVCPPAPLLVAAPAVERRGWPSLRLAGALAALLVVAGFAGVAWAHAQTHHAATLVPDVAELAAPSLPPTHVRPTAASPEDWLAVMSRLDRARDAAFATGDEATLRAIYAPGSAVLQKDVSAIRLMTAHHTHARGLHLAVSSVSLLARDRTTVTLRVVDRLPAYDIVDAHDRVVKHHDVRGARQWTIGLQRSGDRWLIASVR